MLLEQSILNNIKERKDSELNEEPTKKSRAELNKIKKKRMMRKGKAKDPKRSAAMRKVWASKRSQMMKGWKNRKKLYGPSGRLAEESMKAIKDFLASLMKSKVLIPESYGEFKKSVGNFITAVVADSEATPEQVYEAVLFNVSPLQAIIEGIADREEMDVTETDIENIDKYFKFLDEDSPEDEGDGDDGDDGGDDESNESIEIPEGTEKFLEEFDFDLPDNFEYEDIQKVLENVEFTKDDLKDEEMEILKALKMEDKIV